MTDIELVIKIDEEIYQKIKETNMFISGRRSGRRFDYILFNAVYTGIPLPKGCYIQRIIPKRVNIQKWIYTKCPNPNCDHILSTHHGDGYYSIEHQPDFCPNCGQALLWESEDTEDENND